jgi:hypothetical protein
MERVHRVRIRADLLYRTTTEKAMLDILRYLPLLARSERLGAAFLIQGFFQSEIRGEPKHKRIGNAYEILKLHPLLQRACRAAGADSEEQDRGERLLLKPLADLSTGLKRGLRLWSLPRPWRWLYWLRFEWRLKAAEKQIARLGR